MINYLYVQQYALVLFYIISSYELFTTCKKWILFVLLTGVFFFLFLEIAESQPGSDGRRLRSHRHIRAHRQSGAGLQRNRHRAETLVRHVGVAEASDRAVAHAKGSGRRRQKLSRKTTNTAAAADRWKKKNRHRYTIHTQ